MLIGSAKWVEGVATENKKFRKKRDYKRLMCSKVDVRLALNESTFPSESSVSFDLVVPTPSPFGPTFGGSSSKAPAFPVVVNQFHILKNR